MDTTDTEKTEGTEPFADEVAEGDAGPNDVFALAAELRRVEVKLARLREREARANSRLVVMDGKAYLEAVEVKMYAEKATLAAHLAASHGLPEYQEAEAEALRLERQVAELEADRKELATCLLVELVDLRDWDDDEGGPDGEEQDFWPPVCPSCRGLGDEPG